jgi:hypothetical protein
VLARSMAAAELSARNVRSSACLRDPNLRSVHYRRSSEKAAINVEANGVAGILGREAARMKPQRLSGKRFATAAEKWGGGGPPQ